MSKTFIFLPLILVLIIGCQTKDAASIEKIKFTQVEKQKLANGFSLLEANCFSCHNPQGTKANLIAPPMGDVKRHYNKRAGDLKKFTRLMLSFMTQPREEKAIMKDALKRFGLMPQMSINEDQIEDIAFYLYHTPLEKKDWFENHYKEEQEKHKLIKKSQQLSPKEVGMKAVLRTKGVLGKNLMGAIKSKGTLGALQFCNTRAIPLTDSMNQVLKTKIKRVSDKNRNPNNVANKEELTYILNAKMTLANGGKVEPQMIEKEASTVGYYPIMTNKMCLQCHGKPNVNIKKEVAQGIKLNYPLDKAIGYGENELRGIWVVEMDN